MAAPRGRTARARGRRTAAPLLALLLAWGLAAAQEEPLLLRGGTEGQHDLGCLTCSRFEPDSVTNEDGPHGGAHGFASIRNRHGLFGSRYADTSACNPYARHPPRVVTRGGRFVGLLTLNERLPDALLQDDLLDWLRGVCG